MVKTIGKDIIVKLKKTLMIVSIKLNLCIVVDFFLVITEFTYGQQSHFEGDSTDSITREALFGVNKLVSDTSIGKASNVGGERVIRR